MNIIIAIVLARCLAGNYSKELGTALLQTVLLTYATIAFCSVVGIVIHCLRYLHFFGYDEYITMMLWVGAIPFGIMVALLAGYFVTTRTSANG